MGDTPAADNALTDRLLRSWLRCRRKAWLDRHGNPAERRWTAHRNLLLDDQQRCFVALLPRKPGHGIAACAAGAEAVVGLRLKGLGPSGEPLEAHPPLLRRVKGKSRWGDFAYQPVLARQGRRTTREHQLPLALMALLLEQHQQGDVPSMLVLGGGGRRLEQERLHLSSGLRRQLSELAADRRKCSLCSWRVACNAVAAEEGHLSEVSGIGAKRREMLLELGIRGLSDLAAADPLARAQRDGRVERLDASAALPELQDCPGVLLYDIESDPDARHDFLHGFLVLPRTKSGNWDLASVAYHPILALAEHGEARCWLRLQRLLNRYRGWPILHYGETESLALRRMAERQGAAEAEVLQLRQRLVDVHARVRHHWRLPLASYGLKAVAVWQGFQWSQAGVDGARALLWWRQWQGEGPDRRGTRHGLRWIFDYNRDDCLATWAVADWLLEQDQASGS